MKEFTKEMLNKLQEAERTVIGTPKYTKFKMEAEWKDKNKWKFFSHSIPWTEGHIKTFKGQTYIMMVNGYGDMIRFHVTDEVKALLNI